jgi:hypothetical protein
MATILPQPQAPLAAAAVKSASFGGRPILSSINTAAGNYARSFSGNALAAAGPSASSSTGYLAFMVF